MFCAAALSKLILFYCKPIKVLFLGLGFSAVMQDLNANLPLGENCCDFTQSSTFVLFTLRLIPGKKAGSDTSATPTVTRSLSLQFRSVHMPPLAQQRSLSAVLQLGALRNLKG